MTPVHINLSAAMALSRFSPFNRPPSDFTYEYGSSLKIVRP